jgi:hypothetical protein
LKKRVLYGVGWRNLTSGAGLNAVQEPRFVADKMLGRLARWLRILGCDVLYGTNFSGKGLLQAARSQQRIALTRDRRMVRDPQMPPHLLVEGDHFREQLRQVVSAFSIDPMARLFRRCVECNAELEEIDRQGVAGSVPEFVLATQRTFRRCPRCRHLYWDATHVARIRAELARMGICGEAEDGR